MIAMQVLRSSYDALATLRHARQGHLQQTMHNCCSAVHLSCQTALSDMQHIASGLGQQNDS